MRAIPLMKRSLYLVTVMLMAVLAFACDDSSGTVDQTPCTIDDDCGDGKVCGSDGFCTEDVADGDGVLPGRCDFDSQCDPGLVCCLDACVLPADCHCTVDDECVLDQDCASAEYCTGNCVCSDVGDIDGDSDTEQGGDECKNDEECPENQKCVNGICKEGPALVITPVVIDFGTTQLDVQFCRKLGLSNEGTATLQIFSMEFIANSSPDFHWVSDEGDIIASPASSGEITLGVDESVQFNVCVTPTDPGKDIGRIEIISNDTSGGGAKRYVDLTTQYKGETYLEVVSPSDLYFDFGSIEVGQSGTMQITINSKREDEQANKILSIGPIQFDPENVADFSVPDTVQPNEIKYVQQGESLSFQVYFRPQSEGMKTVELVVYHDADYYPAGEQPLTITLVGTGVVPCLTIEPNPIDFGQVTVGQTTSVQVMLRSTCGGTVRMEGLEWKAPVPEDFAIVDIGSAATAPIPPGGRVSFQITYTPQTIGNDFAFLLLKSNNAAQNTVQVTVQGQGVQSVIDVDPDELDFDEVLVQTEKRLTFKITNMGQGDLELLGYSFDQNPAFTLDPFDAQKFPMSLQYAESVDITVVYRPTNTTPEYVDYGQLTISTNNPSYLYINIPLEGTPVWPLCDFSVIEMPNFIDTINFGEVNLGTTEIVHLRVTNHGAWPCEIENITRGTNTSAEFTYLAGFDPIIPPNNYFDITVHYSPINYPGPDYGSLIVATNDLRDEYANFEVKLEGLGVNPTIFIEPTSTQNAPHNFGQIYKDTCSDPVIFHIQNTGIGTLQVDPNFDMVIGIPGAWVLGELTFPLNGLPNGHLRNFDDSGDEIIFPLQFCPLGFAGFQQQGQIRVFSNDMERQTKTIYTVGTGVECPIGWYDNDGICDPNVEPYPCCEYHCQTPDWALFPIEKCDTYDNDCNGEVDEGYNVGDSCSGIGECKAGFWECAQGLEFTARCSSMPNGSNDMSSYEKCNGLDDNCDGKIDEDFPVNQQCVGEGACGIGTLECDGNYTTRCSTDIGGSDYPDPAPLEVCDHQDNDCDGFTDNGVFIVLNTGDPPQSCDNCLGVVCSGQGDCGWGTYECALDQPGGLYVRCCSDLGGSCQDVDYELCDNRDNDCNGQTDETFNIGEPCDGIGRCIERSGLTQCDPQDDRGTICSTDIGGDDYPYWQETCNSLDDDCDGQTDEDFGVGNHCLGTGECARFDGEIECNPAGGVPGQPIVICSTDPGGSNEKWENERCDGKDNDCDGLTDEDFNVGMPCIGIGECGRGVIECETETRTVCSTNPGGSQHQDTTEVCDGRDNDCDELTDEDIVGSTDVGDPCDGEGLCGPGHYVCAGLRDLICSTEPGGPNNEAQPESCNRLDDDCDGLTDEDYLYGQLCEGTGECGEGTWECDGTNGRICSTDPGGSQDQSMPELCDGKDNDCDNLIDEDFPMCEGELSINNCGACGQTCVVSHGTPVCEDYDNGSCGCEVESCNTGWHDTDELYSTGCECRDDEWDLQGASAGDSCGGALQVINPLTDNDRQRTTISGNLAGPDDEDWFIFRAVDGQETGPNYADEFNVQVIVSEDDPSGEVVVDIYKNDCSTRICNATPHFRYMTDSSWNFQDSGDPWYTGHNPCLPTNLTGCNMEPEADECYTPYNWCEYEDITFYIRVHRVLPVGQRATCGAYTLEISNGFYSSN